MQHENRAAAATAPDPQFEPTEIDVLLAPTGRHHRSPR
jgi:hypothetical protein